MSTNINKQNISIIIVNYNSLKHLKRLVKSIKFIINYVGEIIIINNSKETINLNNSKVRVIKNKNNIGFANAINQGIRIAKYKYILTLNPDTIIIDNSISKMFRYFLQNNNIGAIGGKILDMKTNSNRLSANTMPNFFTGIFEFTILKKIFPNNYFSKKFWPETNGDIIEPIKVSSICGAFLMFRKYANRKINLFDNKFFLYMEDVDFGISINSKGFKVIFFPAAKIKHIGGASNNSKYKILLKEWYKSRKYFFLKNLPTVQGLFLYIIFSVEEKILAIYHIINHEPIY